MCAERTKFGDRQWILEKPDDYPYQSHPITDEQRTAITHYIRRQKRKGRQIDESEISAMVEDMLSPPMSEYQSESMVGTYARGDAERASSLVGETMEEIGAVEERKAVMEGEAMRRG